MRRKSAGKKIMVVLVAASLALTPAELTVAAEMETENVEASFSEEENGDIFCDARISESLSLNAVARKQENAGRMRQKQASFLIISIL